MVIRDSMMARLALLVGIALAMSGYASCSFSSGPNGGLYPGVPGTLADGRQRPGLAARAGYGALIAFSCTLASLRPV